MNFKKPTKKTMTNTTATAAGVVVGVKASKAVESFLADKNETLSKATPVVFGAALALGVEGANAASHAARGAGIGMIIDQGLKALDKAVNGKLPTNSKVLSAMFDGDTPTKTMSPTLTKKLASAMGNTSVSNGIRMGMPSQHGGFVAG